MHARESLAVKKLLGLSIIQQTNSYQCTLLGSITTDLSEKGTAYALQTLQLHSTPEQKALWLGMKFIFLTQLFPTVPY